jgi:hypothetical protein
MNARLILVLVVFSVGVSSECNLATANAEWYRPLTWGEKKPGATSRSKKNDGVIGGTKQVIAKTADVLTPWDNNKKQDNPIDGAGRFFRPDLAHKKRESETSWYRPATWFRRETTPEKPLTVTDWMSQQRPEFENR